MEFKAALVSDDVAMVNSILKVLAKQYSSALCMANLVERLVSVMQWVEKIKYLTGPQKKAIVLRTLLAAADMIPGETPMEQVIELALPAMVDWLVVADRKGLRLNPQLRPCVQKCKGCFSGCFG